MISVIVPVRNGAAFLERCIASIAGNTVRDIEIIIVENGSTDNTYAIAKALAAGDGRIRLLSTDVCGLSNARNIGLENASGEYISFVDADDYISPVMLERLKNAVEVYSADLALCELVHGADENFDFPQTGSPVNAVRELTMDEYFRETYLRAQYKYSFVTNKLFSRKLIGDNRFNTDLGYIEDRNFTIRYVLSCKKIISVPDALYYYYKNPNSISNSASQRERMSQVYATLSDIDILSRPGVKPLYRDYAYANLLQLADFRLRQAKKYHLDDIQSELLPIIAKAKAAVLSGGMKPVEKARFLGEHYYYALRNLVKYGRK